MAKSFSRVRRPTEDKALARCRDVVPTVPFHHIERRINNEWVYFRHVFINTPTSLAFLRWQRNSWGIPDFVTFLERGGYIYMHRRTRMKRW